MVKITYLALIHTNHANALVKLVFLGYPVRNFTCILKINFLVFGHLSVQMVNTQPILKGM